MVVDCWDWESEDDEDGLEDESMGVSNNGGWNGLY